MPFGAFARPQAPARGVIFGFAFAVSVAWGAPPAAAQADDAAPEDEVIATVNGAPVRYSDIELAERDLRAQLDGVPDDVKFEYLVGVVIDRKVLASASLAAGLENDPEVERQVAFYRERALADVYLTRQLEDAVSDADARAFYDQQISQIELQEEVRARHILVASEEEARAVVARLEAGEDFVAVAQDVSIGPSGADGGDLGYFTADRMVPEFSDAAFALEPGAISDPIQSEFGWHVIKVEDRRPQQLVTFEEVKESIKARLRQDKAAPYVEEARNAATIEYVGAGTTRPQIVPQP